MPGTWVEVPQVGYLWTPGYWGWGGGGYLFHEGYWGPHVGFYGGINYGFGYVGNGYQGGRWQGNHFAYNTYVNHVNTTIIHNTYNTTIVNVNETHVSYNGGQGGVQARPSAQEATFANERHVGPVAAQAQHVQAARSRPELRATTNQGRPAIAATSRPSEFNSGVVASRQAGGEYKPPPASSAHAQPNEAPRAHASDLQPHAAAPPNTGNPSLDKRYQQQQSQLAARQNQDHQRLQQQQEVQHQQAAAKAYSPAQKQQLEQRHAQQTQQLEQKHSVQQQHLQQREPAPRQEERPHS